MERSGPLQDFEDTGACSKGISCSEAACTATSISRPHCSFSTTDRRQALRRLGGTLARKGHRDGDQPPAVGGIVVCQKSVALGVNAIFAEKDDDSNPLLRRGFPSSLV